MQKDDLSLMRAGTETTCVWVNGDADSSMGPTQDITLSEAGWEAAATICT